MPDGWTGEFDPHRAKATIDRLREFESEAQQFRRLKEDPDAQRAFFNELGYEIDEDGDEVAPEWEPQDDGLYEDPNAARIAAMEERLGQMQQQEEMQQLAAHVAELTQDSGVDLETQKYLFEVASAPGYNPQRTEKIVKQHLAAIEKAREAAVEDYRKTKRSPQPPQVGAPGQEAPDLRDDKTRRDYLATLIDAQSME